MTQILAAKQQGLPVKDHVVVKSSKHAQRAAAFRRKQKEDAKQSMVVLSNKPCVGPTEAEVNEWLEDKREQQEEANIFTKPSTYGMSSLPTDSLPTTLLCEYIYC
ncbi:unnamed protein product [Cylindrotheca closterium]|uniref:Uncharacterized protein n=1 Tax=Cylindrotheca closterium TaxID=2856 RepID=A0AAD2JMX7_9STRA|nr:unnamed protein product [Cylindrotheca closterium]